MRSKTISTIIILIGLVLGSFIGEVLSKVPYCNWLSYGQNVGIPKFEINLYAIQMNFGLTFNCTIASIVGLILAMIIYFKLVK